ncbi:MAG TPA: gliding motility lipoprotein GldH [Bacteroidales bacterium]|nr:gliding motility lipoprotein GldH [Bacteroidales bacterium]
MIKNKRNSLVLLFIVFLFISCDPHRVYEKNKEISDFKWELTDTIIFEVSIEDTINPHNIYFNVRNSSKYKKQNLYVFIHTEAPNSVSLTDTFECYLADDKGKWTGSGWGDLYDNQFLYKKNIRFPVSGIYTFKFIHGMRTEMLQHISDVGIRIEKVTIDR